MELFLKDKIQKKNLHTDCCGNNDHHHGDFNTFRTYLPGVISFIMLVSGIFLDYFYDSFFSEWIRIIWYVAAYLPVGLPVMNESINSIKKGDVFTEFFLMTIATIGAFMLKEYPEAVAVMLFYTVGELFQGAAVKNARSNIKTLLDVRPKTATVYRNGSYVVVVPDKVKIGEQIKVKVGEKIPLDGVLITERASLNTAAITGESKPDSLKKGEKVFAGSINLENVIEIEVLKKFEDSSVARIIQLVENATARKSKTELFIRKFARIYTPIVVFTALALTFVPYFFTETYVFQDWLYRALIFLVVSCPCALVVSIPLGYFGGLGAASRNGILFKGASFLDSITKINTVAMDKTGTVTKGVFHIQDIKSVLLSEKDFMNYLIALETQSTHPIAKAISSYPLNDELYNAAAVEEISGKGLKGIVNGKTILAGNKELMSNNHISIPKESEEIVETVVFVAMNGEFTGLVVIADEIKEDAEKAISDLKKVGIHKTIMLSGDKDSITQKIAQQLKINIAKGGLLPEDKLEEIEKIKQNKENKVAFVGDGINDAPVLAASDVGIAMGGLGSDVAIETADVIIQTDQPSKIVTAIKIGKSTREIVWQNIALTFGIKLFVLILGAGGLATMWEAVFADVGVAFLAILNAIRLQRMQWR